MTSEHADNRIPGKLIALHQCRLFCLGLRTHYRSVGDRCLGSRLRFSADDRFAVTRNGQRCITQRPRRRSSQNLWPKSASTDSVSVGPSDDSLEPDAIGLDAFFRFLSVLFRFSRPHTIYGTIISVCSISLLALQETKLTVAGLISVGIALSASVLMNVFIVGLNQVFDISIDKINKPELPLASGDLSLTTAYRILAFSLIGSLGIGCLSGSPPLLITLVVSMILGTAYSADIPLLRWKRNAFVAAACILAIRAVAVQMGFYFHIHHSLGVHTLSLSREVIYAMCLFCYYSVVIALFKDIPDLTGDREARIRTFTVRLGQRTVFWTCIWLLTAMYASAIGIGLASRAMVTRQFFTLGNVFSLSLLWSKALRIDLSVKKEIVAFYMFVWKLFYVMYFFIPLLRIAQ